MVADPRRDARHKRVRATSNEPSNRGARAGTRRRATSDRTRDRSGETGKETCRQTREEARRAIFDYIEIFYNRKRKHAALGYESPVNYARQYWLDQAA